jgi:hypothetical protein
MSIGVCRNHVNFMFPEDLESAGNWFFIFLNNTIIELFFKKRICYFRS